MSTYVSVDGAVREPVYLPDLTQNEVDLRSILLKKMGEEGVLPYTTDQERIFSAARQALQRTSLALSPLGYSLILSVPVILTLIAAGTIKADPKVAIVMGVLAVVISNVVSMYFTGTLPNNSSNAQNQDQDEMQILKDRFEDLGFYILQGKIEENEGIIEEAKKIYHYIEEKEGLLIRATTQKGFAKTTMRFLRDVVTYVATGKTNYNSHLEHVIKSLNGGRTLQLSA